MTVLRCRDCGGFVARYGSAPAEVVGTVGHSREAGEERDVVPCARCGTLHEVRRGSGE